ncbi:MAG: type II toxin-antitoxin system prevent-host-death family antitoxin [Lysobacterales bacterium]
MRTELVTTLKRQATALLADIERDRKPILITQHGLPGAYLVDVETWQLQQERMAILGGIARGEMAIAEAARSRKRRLRNGWRSGRAVRPSQR